MQPLCAAQNLTIFPLLGQVTWPGPISFAVCFHLYALDRCWPCNRAQKAGEKASLGLHTEAVYQHLIVSFFQNFLPSVFVQGLEIRHLKMCLAGQDWT